ncbi:MAG: SDR family NAD(P)-dependent oxidoreductase [Ilumatobacteraceae bacterium]
MRLECGQIAVVTGAASGIGYGLCEGLARRGVAVVLADVDDTSLKDAEAGLGSFGVPTMSAAVDVTSYEQVERLATSVFERFGRVDLLCNNAGVTSKYAPAWEFDLAIWRWMIDVNLWGVIYGIRAFVPQMVRQGFGHVLNTASMAGICTIPLNGPYNAAKHAVVSITETLAGDFAEFAPNLGATVLCPGPTRTRLMSEGSRWRPSDVTPDKEVGEAPRFSREPAFTLDVPESVEATLSAIERNQLHIAPNVGSRDRVLSRIEPLLLEVDH